MSSLIDGPLLSSHSAAAEIGKQQKENKVQTACVQAAVVTIVDAAFKQLQECQQADKKAEEIQARQLQIVSKELRNSPSLLSVLEKRKITREKDVYELLRTHLTRNGYLYPEEIFKTISLYIKSQQMRVELAKLIFAKGGMIFLREPIIKELDIIREEDRVEIAKSLISENIDILIENIDNFNIAIEENRVEIAKMAAASAYGAKVISKDIALFKIAKESNRIAIAKIAAAHEGFWTSRYTGKRFYDIRNAEALIEIAHIAIRQDLQQAVVIVKNILETFEASERDSKKAKENEFFQKEEVVFAKHCELREEIRKVSDDEKIREELSQWLDTYISLCKMSRLSEAQINLRFPYAQQIMRLHIPDIRFLLTSILVAYEPPHNSFNNNDSNLLFHLLLHVLRRTVPLADREWEQIAASFSSKTYLDSVKKEAVLRGLLGLLNSEVLNIHDKAHLLKHIFIPPVTASQEKEQKEKVNLASAVVAPHTQFQLLDALILSGNLKKLMMPSCQAKEIDAKEAKITASRLKEPIDLSDTLNQIFTECLGLKKIQDFSIKYVRTISRARNPLALMRYAVKLNGLPQEHRPAAQNLLTDFVTAILEGTYNQWRYQAPAASHLACVFEGRPKLLEQWQQGEQLPLEELLKSEEVSAKETSQKFDVHKYLYQRVFVDKHLDLKDFPDFVRCLQDPTVCEATLKQLGPKLSKLKQGQQISAETFPLFRLKLEAALIGLLNPKESAQKKVERIRTLPFLKEICEKNRTFEQDVEDLKKHLEIVPLVENNTKYTIVDTDHWEDLLLIGTEVVGSCQRIDGDINLNKCLLGYLADGKNRAIAIKDEQSRIVARCIMRILWDAKTQKPVLYQERLYYNPGISQRALAAIDKMFIRRAKALNLTLVRTDEARQVAGDIYPNPLKSLSSISPFEYVDAGPGVANGIYQINAGSIVVFSP